MKYSPDSIYFNYCISFYCSLEDKFRLIYSLSFLRSKLFAVVRKIYGIIIDGLLKIIRKPFLISYIHLLNSFPMNLDFEENEKYEFQLKSKVKSILVEASSSHIS